MIRVLVADDHPAYRRGLELMLTEVDDLELVGFADTGVVAVEMADALTPDVVLMDLRMPDLDGIEATRRIKRLAPAPLPAVVVLASSTMMRSVSTGNACSAPAATCSRGPTRPRSCAPSVPPPPARPSSAQKSLHGSSTISRLGPARQPPPLPALTEREREVLAMIAAGKGNATIAHELMITLKTVRNHVSNIFTKLQVSDRSSAIVKARRAGMSDDRPRRGA